jgi:diguanylate cyclase (GGDEF)-like protein
MHLTPAQPASPVAPPCDAPTDGLTGLLQRQSLIDALRRRIGEATVPARPFALIVLDLDRFKSVNDTLGHPMGDSLLRAVAHRIRRGIRAGDVAGRLDGDEFAVLLPEIRTERDAEAVAARLARLVARPFLLEGQSVVTGCSIGVAVFPKDATDANSLLRCADLALSQAKAECRGSHRRYVPALRIRAEERRRLEAELREALELGQFELHYQPQVDLASGRLAGLEALLRWRHPRRGLVPPADFLSVAEDAGLMVALGEWVLRTACRDAAAWPDTRLFLAVNVAAAQLARRDLAAQVREALADGGLAPHRLELEVTESGVLHDIATACATCEELRRDGVRISLDDFGTGYSSLTQLRSFPLDRVKIDRSFVLEVDREPASAAIVKAVAELGASLGLRTTAEGVETARQLSVLRGHGCTDAQGFLFSKPVPAAEVAAVVAEFASKAGSQDTALQAA